MCSVCSSVCVWQTEFTIARVCAVLSDVRRVWSERAGRTREHELRREFCEAVESRSQIVDEKVDFAVAEAVERNKMSFS